MSLPSPVIAAITSMKVTQYKGELQLTATPASYIYVNPETNIATTLAAEFKVRNDAVPILTITYEKSENTQIEMLRNRVTLAQLMEQNPSRYMGAQFTCKAALTRIDEGKGWFYKACSQCHKKLQPCGDALACSDHEPVNEPTNLYFFTAHIADHTGEVKILFFDNAAATLLESDCNTMIEKLGFVDPYTLPEPLMAVRGQTKVFQIRYRGSNRGTAMEFAADRVFEDTSVTSVTKPTSVQTEQHKKQRHCIDASDKKIQPTTPAEESIR